VDFLRDLVAHLALPLATISLGLIGGYSILMRSSITETRAEDYIATARRRAFRTARSCARTRSPTRCCRR